MHGKTMTYVLVAGAALVAGLLLAGSPVQALLPFVLLLACPLMMIVMMRGMGGHGDGHSNDAGPTESIGHDHSGELKPPVSDRRG
jgi:hypothetical protein